MMSPKGSFRSMRWVAAPLLLAGGLGCASMDFSNADQVSRTLTPGVAFSLLRDTPQTPILDLRSEAEFHGSIGHLARARSLPPERFDATRRWFDEIGQTTVLTYCEETCDAELIHRLTDLGLEVALVLDGGIKAWIAEGYGTAHEERGGLPCARPPAAAP